jgi:hypothetical protein
MEKPQPDPLAQESAPMMECSRPTVNDDNSRTTFHFLTDEPHRWKSEWTGWPFGFSDGGSVSKHNCGVVLSPDAGVTKNNRYAAIVLPDFAAWQNSCRQRL